MRKGRIITEKKWMRKKWVKGDSDFSIKPGHDNKGVVFKCFFFFWISKYKLCILLYCYDLG
jgi:hypothetical protein